MSIFRFYKDTSLFSIKKSTVDGGIRTLKTGLPGFASGTCDILSEASGPACPEP
ncbi:MAG: hypothetical protein ACYTEQ_21945 [Planctomycetota bacterium]|jgi:hypothetical protein